MLIILFFFFFKQKTAYEMRISDWSSDVCSSDLLRQAQGARRRPLPRRQCRPHGPALHAGIPHRRDPHGLTDLPRRAQARPTASAGAAVSLPRHALRPPLPMHPALSWKPPWRKHRILITRYTSVSAFSTSPTTPPGVATPSSS